MTKWKWSSLLSFERYFFLFVTIFNLYPALCATYFPTLDGAAHLYNSQLICTLLSSDSDVLRDFFAFNHEPVPNYTGHIILAIFNSVLPAFIAEKILLLTYLVGLPYAFRNLLKTINPDSLWLTYLIFPFTYSFVFFLGFYNFSLALVLWLLTLNYGIKDLSNFTLKRWCILALLLILTYFSHIFVFGILVFLLALYQTLQSAVEWINQPANRQTISQRFIRGLAYLFSAAALPLILLSLYFLSRQNTGAGTFVPVSQLIDWLMNIKPIIALNTAVEEVYTKRILLVLVALGFAVFASRLKSFLFPAEDGANGIRRARLKALIRSNDYWFMASGMLLVLYFMLPDSDGQAGFVSVRLALMFFILFITWLASQPMPRTLSVIASALILYYSFSLNSYYKSAVVELSAVAEDCAALAEVIPSGSIVLPVNVSDNWLLPHFSNYLGVDKPIILLENYECGVGYFPLVWNERAIPDVQLGNTAKSTVPCIHWKQNSTRPAEPAEYVVVLGDMHTHKDTCLHIVQGAIEHGYELAHSGKNCTLYRLK